MDESDARPVSEWFKGDDGKLCAWKHPPTFVDPTWLGQERDTGVYGWSPYVYEEMRSAYEDAGIKVQVEREVEREARVADRVRRMAENAQGGPGLDVDLAGENELYDFQRVAPEFFDATGGRFLLADSMGLGKSCMAIACSRHADANRILVVCPSAVKYQWQAEIERFDGSESHILEGRDAEPDTNLRWNVANYAILKDCVGKLESWNPDFVIYDEVHYIKNPSAKRSKAAVRLGEGVEHVIGLSGTPITNRPKDLWNILNLLQPGWWGKKHDFERAFCDGRRVKYGSNIVWKADGLSNEETLHDRLKAVMLRRRKSEVLDDLPSRSRTVMPVHLTREGRMKYREAEEGFAREAEEADWRQGTVLRKLMALRRISSVHRVEKTVERAESVVESRGQVVVFGFFRDSLNRISDALSGSHAVETINGDTTSRQRQDRMTAFQDDGLDALVGQVQAMGEGLNLQVADTSIHHDVTWSPHEADQCESRIHRMDQENPTHHIYLAGKDTVDERILDTMMEKLQMSRSVLDTGESIEGEVVEDLRRHHFDAESEDL